jgi:mannose/fructose-specific phosphotransferase system component IIA
MRKTTSAIAALAVIVTRLGLPAEAHTLVDEALLVEERCEFYRTLDDRTQLLTELEQLLELNPDDSCIPFLVDLLGGSTVAEVLAADPY